MTSKTQKDAAKAGTEMFESAAKAGKEGFEQAVKAGTEAWTQGFTQATTVTREQIQKFYPAGLEGFDELTEQQKATVEAIIASGEAAAKGAEAFGEELVKFNQKAYDKAMGNAKALMGAKTVQDAVALQTGFVREGFDDLLAQQAKFSELAVKYATEATQPLNATWAKTAESFSKPFGPQS